MRTKFNSAPDYLAYLQERYTRSYTDNTFADAEFQRLTEEALRDTGIEIRRGHLAGVNDAISNLWHEILEGFDKEQRIRRPSRRSAPKPRSRACP